jgi:hypothetical protein
MIQCRSGSSSLHRHNAALTNSGNVGRPRMRQAWRHDRTCCPQRLPFSLHVPWHSTTSLASRVTAKNGHSRSRMPSRHEGLSLAQAVDMPPERTPDRTTCHLRGCSGLRGSLPTSRRQCALNHQHMLLRGHSHAGKPALIGPADSCLAANHTMLAWLARSWRQPLPAGRLSAGMAASEIAAP